LTKSKFVTLYRINYNVLSLDSDAVLSAVDTPLNAV